MEHEPKKLTWEDVPGWFDFQDVYDGIIAEAAHGAHFVEVGVAFGKSAIYMATQIARSGKTIRFDAIDRWNSDYLEHPKRDAYRKLALEHGDMYRAFLWFAKQCNVDHMISAYVADQVHGAKMYANGSLDLVFLDTCHTEDGTRAAIKAWLPKIKPGGVFAGHDYVKGWPGVVRAVNDLLVTAVEMGNCFFYRLPG